MICLVNLVQRKSRVLHHQAQKLVTPHQSARKKVHLLSTLKMMIFQLAVNVSELVQSCGDNVITDDNSTNNQKPTT